MDQRTRYDSLDEAIDSAIEAKLAHLHTSLHCTIVSADFKKQTCVMQPTAKARVRMPDGSQSWVMLPQLLDVPMHFPSGGGVTMTFPVKEGDEALAVFSSRSQDNWQQQGGDQQQIDLRQHDLSNASAFVGFKSNPKALANVSSSSTQIRSDDGKHVVDVHPANGLTLSSSEGVTTKVGGVTFKVSSAGVDGSGGYLKWNGKTIDDTHTHTGVSTGSGTSGPPA